MNINFRILAVLIALVYGVFACPSDAQVSGYGICADTAVSPNAQAKYAIAYAEYQLALAFGSSWFGAPIPPVQPALYNPLPQACDVTKTIPCDIVATLCYCKALFKNPYSNPPWQRWYDPNSAPANQPVYAFAGPVVQCFTNMNTTTVDPIRTASVNNITNNNYTPQLGIIPAITFNFMMIANKFYLPVMKAIMTVVIALYGIKLAAGNVKNVKKDTWMMMFKMGGIFFFMVWAPRLYQWMMVCMQQLATLLTEATNHIAAADVNGGGFCIAVGGAGGGVSGTAATNTFVGTDLWGVWDCVFSYLLIAAGTVGMASMLVLAAKAPGISMVVAVIGMYVIVSLFFAVARSIHIYLMGVLGFSFMFSMGYIFVPLLFFNSEVTKQYFQKWMNICIGYALAPVILLGFMATMLVALDVATLSGQYSIIRQVAPDTFGPALNHRNIRNPANNPLFLISQKQLKWSTAKFKRFADVSLNNSAVQASSNCATTAGGPTGTNYGTGKVTQGIAGNLVNTHQSADCYLSNSHPTSTSIGLPQDVLDPSQMVDFGIQYTPGPDETQIPTTNGAPAPAGNDLISRTSKWQIKEFLAFATAALLSYIMYALLDYIPNLASDLASQGSASVTALGSSKFFGEKMFAKATEASGGAALSAAKALEK